MSEQVSEAIEPKITIVMKGNSDRASVELVEEDGSVKKKVVGTEDIINGLIRRNMQSTGIVPPGTRYFRGSAGRYLMVVEVVPKVRDFKLWIPVEADRADRNGVKYEPKTLQIPFPRMLFLFFIEDNIIISSSVFALENSLTSDKTKLYRFPFGNSYEDGKICWGDAVTPMIKNPMSVIGIINLFIEAPFNGDLMEQNPFIASDGYTDFWSLIRHLDGKETFPTEILKYSGMDFSKLLGTIYEQYKA